MSEQSFSPEALIDAGSGPLRVEGDPCTEGCAQALAQLCSKELSDHEWLFLVNHIRRDARLDWFVEEMSEIASERPLPPERWSELTGLSDTSPEAHEEQLRLAAAMLEAQQLREETGGEP